jgi:hypothetical protein
MLETRKIIFKRETVQIKYKMAHIKKEELTIGNQLFH